jgi:hypothetical protein
MKRRGFLGVLGAVLAAPLLALRHPGGNPELFNAGGCGKVVKIAGLWAHPARSSLHKIVLYDAAVQRVLFSETFDPPIVLERGEEIRLGGEIVVREIDYVEEV